MSRAIYLMSPPRPDWALKGKANFKSSTAAEADAALAIEEWRRLADTIVEAGGEVLVCPPSEQENLTGLIYTAEAGEFYRGPSGEPRFILPNMAVPHRQAEAVHLERFVTERLGWQAERIDALWEAQGDVIRGRTGEEIVHTYGQGRYARTSSGAYGEVADRLGGRHMQLEFKADPWFHGNTFLQVFRGVDEARVIVCPDALAEGELARLHNFFGDTAIVEISPEESKGYDTNALQVEETVIAPATLSATTRRAIESLGLEVRTLDLGELFLKGGGAPVCLTNRLWGLDEHDLPDDVRWSRRG